MSDQSKHSLSRRQMLRLLGVGSAGLVLAACVPQATEAVKPTDAGAGEVADQPSGSETC